MLSLRNVAVSPVVSPEDTILDAALASVLAVGFRRTTLTEVARRAGVSRMTAYRRFTDADSLIRSLMTREFGRLLEGVFAATGSANTAGERLVSLLVAAVRELPNHPLMRKVVELDVDLLGPYVVDHLGSTQRAAEAAILGLVRQAKEEGSITVADPVATTMVLLLATQSMVLSRKILVDSGLDDEALAAWEDFLRGALRVAA